MPSDSEPGVHSRARDRQFGPRPHQGRLAEVPASCFHHQEAELEMRALADQFQYDLLLSHSSKENAVMRAFSLSASNGERAGVRCRYFRPDDIYLAIERGLEGSRRLVLCMSPNALGSDRMGLDRSTVLFRVPSNTGRRFVPLLLADCKLPDTLRRYKYVDFRKEADAGFDELRALAARFGVGFTTEPKT